MLRKLLIVLGCHLAAGLALGACSSAESTRPDADPVSPPPAAARVDVAPLEAEEGPPADVVSRLVREALQSDGSISYDALRQRLGVPKRIETEPVSNQYVEGQMDTLRTLVYPGLTALVYDVTSEPKTFLVRLSLSSPEYKTPGGLRVGARTDTVLDTLGPPTRRNSSTGALIYQETEPTPTSMIVRIRDGRVTQIDWEFYFT